MAYITAIQNMMGQTYVTFADRHTSQFLMIYLCLIPLGLWTACHWATPAVCCLVAFLLLGIENIGVMIEQPFKVRLTD